MINPWISLAVAGAFEVVWAVGLKLADGFSKPLPSAVTIMAMAASLYFLSLALKEIPLGTAYAIWTGIGAVGTAILGIILFSESTHLIRLLCIALIVVGMVGLKYSST